MLVYQRVISINIAHFPLNKPSSLPFQAGSAALSPVSWSQPLIPREQHAIQHRFLGGGRATLTVNSHSWWKIHGFPHGRHGGSPIASRLLPEGKYETWEETNVEDI